MTLHPYPTATCPDCGPIIPGTKDHWGCTRCIVKAKSNGEHTYYNLDYERQVIDIVAPGRMLKVRFRCGHEASIVTSRPETLALAPDTRGGYRPRHKDGA